MNKIDKMQNYSDVFFHFRLNEDCSCTHQFLNHVLIYVYSGVLEMNDPDRTMTVKSGESAFARKDTCLQMSVYLKDAKEAKVAFLRIPENFLHEFYFTIERQENVPATPYQSFLLLPQREDVDSLFCSMNPYYGTDVAPSKKLLKLKMIEAIYALLQTDWRFYTLLFGFAHSSKMDVLDLLADTCVPPICWQQRKDFRNEPANKMN